MVLFCDSVKKLCRVDSIPFLSSIFADQPNFPNFETSNNFLGVPSGFDKSQVILPS